MGKNDNADAEVES